MRTLKNVRKKKHFFMYSIDMGMGDYLANSLY